jgi:hypothetical protein
MISTITGLLGSGLGALMRYIPEIFKLLTQKNDQSHEYRMTLLQLDIDKARASQQIDLVHANQSLEEARGEMSAYLEAIKGQSQLTGVKWIDGLSQSVRPILSYWWQALFTAYKVCVIIVAWTATKTLGDFAAEMWTTNDSAILGTIIGFWFVDRVIRRGSL